MSRHAVAAARYAGPAGLAAAALLVTAQTSGRWPGYAVACAALVAAWIVERRPRPGTQLPARLLAATAVVVLTGHASPAGTPWLVLTGATLLGVLLAEPAVHRLSRPWYAAHRLPAPAGWGAAAVTSGAVWLAGSALVVLVGAGALLSWPGWALLAPALAVGGLTAAVTVDGWRRRRTGHAAELARLRRAVEEHEPRFVLYFSAPPGSEYQARMWLPQLARLDAPFLVVLPEEHNLAPLAAATEAPLVVPRTFEALDAIMAPSIRAAFYVNNGMKNAHCVRYAHITHIQLYHGDSDKAVTASPLNAMYDLVFVAGQAAVDRFAHYGVHLPAEKFRLVGRPQLTQLATAEEGTRTPDGPPVVLYAPTWAGVHADSNYCSLPIADTIIEGLLAHGAAVILRAHPYAARDRRTAGHLRRAEQLLAADQARTGRPHRWGKAASQPSLFDCMNAAGAMICDVSAVASDFLYTGKPFAITDMVGAGEAFASTFPLARAAYVLDRDAGNLAAVLDDLLEADPLAPARRKLRSYYLGDAPPDRYAGVFLDEARRWI